MSEITPDSATETRIDLIQKCLTAAIRDKTIPTHKTRTSAVAYEEDDPDKKPFVAVLLKSVEQQRDDDEVRPPTDDAIFPEELALTDGTTVPIVYYQNKKNEARTNSLSKQPNDPEAPKKINEVLKTKECTDVFQKSKQITFISGTCMNDGTAAILIMVVFPGLIINGGEPIPKTIGGFPVIVERDY